MTIYELYNDLEKLIKQGKGDFKILDSNETSIDYIEEGFIYDDKKSFSYCYMSNENFEDKERYFYDESEMNEVLKIKTMVLLDCIRRVQYGF